jgi:cbb3-type cytochrome oxidase maturation protein
MFIGSFTVLPGSALLAMRWAAKSGQFDHLEKGALLIFDEEEPVGLVTDEFPSSASRKDHDR